MSIFATMSKHIERPVPGVDYPENSFFARYVDLTGQEDILRQLEAQAEDLRCRYAGITTPEQADFRYAEGKWSLRELLGHMVDTERIFAYRALCIARGEKQNLPGFDENAYMEATDFSAVSLEDLLAYYRTTREASLVLFRMLTEKELSRQGSANGSALTARAFIYILSGHEKHHLSIMADRYQLS